MILRKPYALLIKYFQRIHLLLLLCSAYIFYKIVSLRSFIADFLLTESYSRYSEPITKYINFGLLISIIAIIITVVVLIILLRYKKKPWKLYLLPFFEYLSMFIILLYIRNYFDSYTELSTIKTIMAFRDLLTIIYFIEYTVFILFGLRALGIDLKQFGFKNDEEYLSIKEEDREEFEVNIELDKDKIVRNIKKLFRNIRYVYYEHKFICNAIIVIVFTTTIGYTYYYFNILHKTYQEGSTFQANAYDITVNNSYLTNTDSNGNDITKGKNYSYLVLNITVKNNASKRSINIDRFRVVNKSKQYKYVTREYDNFQDLGKSYSTVQALKPNTSITFILVYKVDKNLNPNKYVLYYHNVSNNILLKKTKLKVQDTRTNSSNETYNLNDEVTFPTTDTLKITSAKILDTTTYTRYTCDSYSCGMKDLPLTPASGKILELSFTSNNFTGESLVDFSKIYAKIKYENSKGKTRSIDINPLVTSFNGNYAYFYIPNDIKDNKVDLLFTFRAKSYLYHLN